MGFHEVAKRGENDPYHATVSLWAMLAQCWAISGLSWDHVWAFGGLCRVPLWFLESKNEPQQTLPPVEVRFGGCVGPMLGQCWVIWGLSWDQVWAFGGLWTSAKSGKSDSSKKI